MIIHHDTVQVVDYKFGTDKEEENYRKQVKEYMNALQQMGYARVEGFLWYIDLNEVIPVQ